MAGFEIIIPEEIKEKESREKEAFPLNEAFSKKNPLLQIVWDATSLSTLKECPRKYYLQVVRGYTTKNSALALDFGIALHEALEKFFRRKSQGEEFEKNVFITIEELLHHPLRKNIDSYEDSVRNSFTLVETVLSYLDYYKNEPCETMVFSDGTIGVELHFQFESGMETLSGEKISFAGHIDRLVRQDIGIFISDHKTTGMPLTQFYFDQYNPDTQMTLYTIAGDIVFATPIKGVVVDAINIKKGEFSRQITLRTKEACEEWLAETEYWFKIAEFFATRGVFPANDKSCNKYSGCPFKAYCTAPRGLREQILQEDFVKRVWDPSKPRGGE